MLKRIGVPFVASLALLILVPPPHAQAEIGFSVGIGAYPAYPAYGYAAPGYAYNLPVPGR